MTFYQEHSVREFHNSDATVVRFVVSDNYDDLFSTDESLVRVDIFAVSSVKTDLNTDDGKFAIDELNFTINQFACNNTNGINALFYTLDVTDINTTRFCALFFGEPISDNMLFIGKIGSKVSGTDKLWRTETEFDSNINPIREYKFSAYSFDVSILEKAKLTSSIKDDSGVPLTNGNVYTRMSKDNWASTKALFNVLPSYTVQTIPLETNDIHIWKYWYYANLFNVLKFYLLQAQDIVNELQGTTLTFNLLESTLGVKTCLTSFVPVQDTATLRVGQYYPNINPVIERLDVQTELRFSNEDYGSGWSVPFVHRSMISPELSNSTDESAKLKISSEQSLSFKSKDNVAELLFDIARSFGCYLLATYTSGTSINLEFKSRSALVESDYTYLIDANDASIDTSSNISSTANQYYGKANNLASDYIDYIDPLTMSISDSLEAQEKTRKYDEDKKGIKSEPLLLTTSTTIYSSKTQNLGLFPVNITEASANWDNHIIKNGIATEILSSGILIAHQPVETPEITRCTIAGISQLYRPATRILVKIDGIDSKFDTLHDYVNAVTERSVQYYETEYSITVPYWNGFSKNTDGSNRSWKHLKKGSKIKLSETVRKIVDGSFVDVETSKDFIVIGIEYNIEKPETKLKLHNTSEFAFGSYAQKTTDVPIESLQFGNSTNTFYEGITNFFIINTGQTIAQYDPVMFVTADNKIGVAQAKSSVNLGTIGIALESGIAGDEIQVLITGLCVIPGSTWTNKRLFIRNTGISETSLQTKTTDEDMFIILGDVLKSDVFKIDIQDYILE